MATTDYYSADGGYTEGDNKCLFCGDDCDDDEFCSKSCRKAYNRDRN